MKQKRMKPWKAWTFMDVSGTTSMHVWTCRRDAEIAYGPVERRIIRVEVREVVRKRRTA